MVLLHGPNEYFLFNFLFGLFAPLHKYIGHVSVAMTMLQRIRMYLNVMESKW